MRAYVAYMRMCVRACVRARVRVRLHARYLDLMSNESVFNCMGPTVGFVCCGFRKGYLSNVNMSNVRGHTVYLTYL